MISSAETRVAVATFSVTVLTQKGAAKRTLEDRCAEGQVDGEEPLQAECCRHNGNLRVLGRESELEGPQVFRGALSEVGC